MQSLSKIRISLNELYTSLHLYVGRSQPQSPDIVVTDVVILHNWESKSTKATLEEQKY